MRKRSDARQEPAVRTRQQAGIAAIEPVAGAGPQPGRGRGNGTPTLPEHGTPTLPLSLARAILADADSNAGHGPVLAADPLRAAGPLHSSGCGVVLPRVSEPQVCASRFVQHWRALAASRDDEMLGLLEAPVRAGTTKLLCLSLIESRSLQTALHRMRGFVHITREDFALRLERARDEATVVIEPGPRRRTPAPLGLMLLLKLVHGLASWLIAQPIPVRQASFAFARQGASGAGETLFPGQVHFDRDFTGLKFDAALLDLPLRRGRRELRSFVARTPYDWLFPPDPPPLAERLRHHLSANLQAPASELDQVAQAMHMSVRTLTRRLRAQGTSFREIKDQVRCELATERLCLSSDPVAAIGEQMGFDDPVSFFRAFRRWTGTSPAAYRAHQRSLAGQAGLVL